MSKEKSGAHAARRRVMGQALQIAGAVTAANIFPGITRCAMAAAVMEESPVVETKLGKLRGVRGDGVIVFKGVSYGQSTAGKNRFMPPVAVPPWTGVRDALEYGPRAPQNERASTAPHLAWIRDTRPTSEDCLKLNVWTPAVNDGGKRPVMVYIHGGGFISGSAGAAGVEGSNLAKHGNVVVVSMNHRLNVFGHCYLGALDARYADSGNVGMLDLIAALQWVRDNAAAFGGDAGNVTIFGQSGGASKVAVLMAMPAAQGLFHKAVIQSASSLLRMAPAAEADKSAQAILTQLGIDKSNVGALQDIPAEQLLKAMSASITATSIDNCRPVVDGRALPGHPFDPSAPAISAKVPLLIGTCETETAFDFSLNPKNFTLSADDAHARVKFLLGVDDAGTNRFLDAYRKTHPGATPSELVIYIFSDYKYRQNDIKAAELKAAQGAAPAYMYLFTWRTPVLDGKLMTPHTLCIPFVFGNVDAAAGITGTAPERYALSEKVQGAWVAFARAGNPNHPGLPAWKPYSIGERTTMIFDNACKAVSDPAGADRVVINTAPTYVAELAGRR
ncbi:MAG: carboxylesterase/lipase family protein [Burkholderiales bacterium]